MACLEFVLVLISNVPSEAVLVFAFLSLHPRKAYSRLDQVASLKDTIALPLCSRSWSVDWVLASRALDR